MISILERRYYITKHCRVILFTHTKICAFNTSFMEFIQARNECTLPIITELIPIDLTPLVFWNTIISVKAAP